MKQNKMAAEPTTPIPTHSRNELFILLNTISNKRTNTNNINRALLAFENNHYLLNQYLLRILNSDHYAYTLHNKPLSDALNILRKLPTLLRPKNDKDSIIIQDFCKAVSQDLMRSAPTITKGIEPGLTHAILHQSLRKNGPKYFKHRHRLNRLVTGIILTCVTGGLSILFRKYILGCRSGFLHLARTRTQKKIEDSLSAPCQSMR